MSSSNGDDTTKLVAAVKRSIRLRKCLLAWTTVARSSCERVQSPFLDCDCPDEQAQFQKLASSSALPRRPRCSSDAAPSGGATAAAGNRVPAAAKSEASRHARLDLDTSAGANPEKHKRKRAAPAAHNALHGGESLGREMELSAHASFAIQRREELLLQLSPLSARRTRRALVLPVGATRSPNVILSQSTSSAELQTQQPPRLPVRRKAHWDYVLEEMHSLSSDFLGERKWKLASAKLMATMVKFRPERTAAATPSSVTKSETHSTSPQKSSVAQDTIIDSSKLSRNESTPKTKRRPQPSAPLYQHPTAQDVDSSRYASRLLSTSILDYWHNCLNDHSADDTIHKRFCAIRNRPICLTKRRSVHNGATGQINSSTQSTTELNFDQISQKVKSSLELVGSLKVQSRHSKNQISSTVRLNHSQNHAFNYVESLWKADSHGTNTPSAVISGDFGTGKTVVASALIWKHRGDGCQLVLCPPGLMHRWREELEKFEGLRVHTCDAKQSLNKAPDVFLRDYPTFFDAMRGAAEPSFGVDLAFIYIDLRYTLNSDEDCYNQLSQSEIFQLWYAINMLLLTSSSSNRLFIEHSALDEDYDGDMELQTKLLALKIACFYGPSLFISVDRKNDSGKRVVSWVHHEHNLLNKILELNLSADSVHMMPFFRVVLDELTQRVRFVMDLDKRVEAQWELRHIGSDRDDEMTACPWKHFSFSNILPGEPNVEIAKGLMQMSPEMAELLTLLTNECGVCVAQQSPARCTANGHSRSIIFIFARTVEARKKTSFFLSSVGIHYEVLDVSGGVALDQIQNAIAQSNENIVRQRPLIVISSPSMLSSISGGVCLAVSNVVICIDEGCDDEVHLAPLTKKICLSERNGNTYRFIKILSEDKSNLISNGNLHSSQKRVTSSVRSDAVKSPILLSSSYGLSSKSEDQFKFGKFALARKNIRHYAQSFYSIQLTKKRHSPTQQKFHAISASEKKASTKQNVQKSEKAARDMISMLSYGIHSQTPTGAPTNHLFALGFYASRDHDLSVFSESSRFQSLVYLPPSSNTNKAKRESGLGPNSIAGQKRSSMVRGDKEFIETNAYSGSVDGGSILEFPAANAVILVAQSESSSTSLKTEASTSSSLNSATSTNDKKLVGTKNARKSSSSYFTKDRPIRRAISIRDTIRSNRNYYPSSVMRSVRLRTWLDNTVSVELPVKSFASFVFETSAHPATEFLQQEYHDHTKIHTMKMLPGRIIDTNNEAPSEVNGEIHNSISSFADATPIPSSCQRQLQSEAADMTLEPKYVINTSSAKTIDLLIVTGNEEESFIHNRSSEKRSGKELNVGDEHWLQSQTSMLNQTQSTTSLGADLVASMKETYTTRRIVTATIPGSATVDGQTTVRIVPVHVSHREALQSAPTTFGMLRNEMWPMELINCKSREAEGANQPRMSSQYNSAYTRAVPIQGARNQKK